MFGFHKIVQWLRDDKNRWTIEKLHNGTRIIQRPAPDVPLNRILPMQTRPLRDFQPDTRRAILADALVEMHRAAADAWHAWLPEGWTVGARVADIIAMPRPAQPDDTLLLRRARPITFEPLPLMSNPFAPQTAVWREKAIMSIRHLLPHLDDDQRCTLDLAERHPDWLHIDISIHALDVPTWRQPNVRFQIGPTLFNVLCSTLGFTATECDINPITFVRDGREIGWCALVWVDNHRNDGLGEMEMTA